MVLLADHKIEIDVEAKDDATGVFRKVANSTVSMADKINSSIINFGNGLRSYNISMNDFNRTALRVFESAGRAAYNFTKDAIKNFADLEFQHSKTMGAMANNYDKTSQSQAKFLQDSEKLKQQAIKMGTVGPSGNGSLYKAQDVSSVQTELIKSGITADQITKSDAVQQILKFAGGNDLDIGNATDFAVNLGNTFKIPTKQWGKYLNEVTRAADISTIDVPDIMESVKYAGGIASGLNRPLEEVLGALSVMGNAGLKGTMSGTGLQAFFTRILNPFDANKTSAMSAPAPDDKVKKLYTSFTKSVTDKKGNLLSLDKITPLMDATMGGMNDKEQAWFAQKLFGLFQMKAAFALKRTGTNGENVLGQSIKDIKGNSSGTNDNKWKIMLNSQEGGWTAFKNAYNGISSDVGDKLSPAVKAAQTELYNFLTNNGNYKIDFTKLKKAINQSGDAISKQYGKQLGDLVKNLGDMGIDGSRVIAALFPEAAGIGGTITKLLGGDVSGALKDFSDGLDNTNKNIGTLPTDLQNTAKGARDVVAAFAILSGINLGAKVLEIFTNIYRTTIGKVFKAMNKAIINSTSVDVKSTEANIQSSVVNMKAVETVNINANVVYVNGKSIGGPGGVGGKPIVPVLPGGGSPSGTPLLTGGTPTDPFAGVSPVTKFATMLGVGTANVVRANNQAESIKEQSQKDQVNINANKVLFDSMGDVTGTDAYRRAKSDPLTVSKIGYAGLLGPDIDSQFKDQEATIKNTAYKAIVASIPKDFTNIWANKIQGLNKDDAMRVEGLSYRYAYDKKQAGVVVSKEEYAAIVDQLVKAIKDANVKANNSKTSAQKTQAQNEKNKITAGLPAGYYPQPINQAQQNQQLGAMFAKYSKSQPINNQITTQTTVSPNMFFNPNVNVNVKVDGNGNVVSKSVSQFPMTGTDLFNYVSKQTSRYGGGKN